MPEDLYVAPGPGLPDGLLIPGGELVERFSRSPGPGGQSVNTTDSRVVLTFEPTTSQVLTDDQRRRLGGTVRAVSRDQRSQHRNRVAARERLADLIRQRLAPPPPTRVPTKPSKSSQRRRMDAKTRRGQVKSLRGRVRGE